MPVPLGDGPGPEGERGLLTADLGGVRFILAFSDEQALARYAIARGEAAREWSYQTVLEARLLDVAVPAAGVPCGVALDCADGEEGMVFPPVCGIVPDEVAVDFGSGTGGRGMTEGGKDLKADGLALIAKGLTEALGELKELGMVGEAGGRARFRRHRPVRTWGPHTGPSPLGRGPTSTVD